jgi:hypothetical protein
MTCNIDQRGRNVRAVSGALCVTAAVLLAILALVLNFGAWWVWLLAVLLGVGGAFQIYEARRGWCALRALGVKTPV